MGQHLGFAKNSCMLRTHLRKQSGKPNPQQCDFRLVAVGPILSESKKRKKHQERRDRIATVEKALAEAMQASGYKVMNIVRCRKPLDAKLWRRVVKEFAKQFSKLKKQKNRASRGELRCR
jgi:hypothetical protein